MPYKSTEGDASVGMYGLKNVQNTHLPTHYQQSLRVNMVIFFLDWGQTFFILQSNPIFWPHTLSQH